MVSFDFIPAVQYMMYFIYIFHSKSIPVSTEIQLLGVTLDNKLKFDSHVASICRKAGGQVNALNRLKNVLNRVN